jgi:phage-related protein (TIGR01555 family)
MSDSPPDHPTQDKVTELPRKRGKGLNMSYRAFSGAQQVSPGGMLAMFPELQDRKPFDPAQPPKGVVPQGVRPMALDWQPADLVPPGSSLSFGEGQYWLGFPALADLAQRAEYRMIVGTIAREMTREWVRITSRGNKNNGEKIQQIEAAMRKWKIKQHFTRQAELAGFFGRGHLYLDLGVSFDDRDLLQAPIVLDPRTVGKGCIKNIRSVEPNWVYPGAYNANNPLARDFYKPYTWYVMQRTVHVTRLLPFVMNEVPDMLKPSYSFGGISMTQLAMPYVNNWLRTRQSVSDLIHSFAVNVLKTDMSSVLEEGGGEQEAMRANLFNYYRDNLGLLMLDKEREEFDTIATPLGTLDHLQAQSQEQMAFVAGTPLVVLTGITPSGLNASSDGELQTWAQRIHAMQEHLYEQPLNTILQLIQLDLFGEIDEDIVAVFNPLKEESKEDLANRRKAEAETHKLYVDLGAVDQDEVRETLASDEDSPYGGIDLGGPAPGPPANALGGPGGLFGSDPGASASPGGGFGKDASDPRAAASRAIQSLLAQDVMNTEDLDTLMEEHQRKFHRKPYVAYIDYLDPTQKMALASVIRWGIDNDQPISADLIDDHMAELGVDTAAKKVP